MITRGVITGLNKLNWLLKAFMQLTNTHFTKHQSAQLKINNYIKPVKSQF